LGGEKSQIEQVKEKKVAEEKRTNYKERTTSCSERAEGRGLEGEKTPQGI